MSFENPLFLIPAICGPIFILAGFIQLKFPPKKINGLYGYRTKNSMESQAKWDFAQKFSSREMVKMGVILTLISILGLLVDPEGILAAVLSFGLLFLFVTLLLIRTEKAIKKEFGKG